MKRELLKSHDGKTLSVAVWDDVADPIAVVQLAHGMSEHIARYDHFANFLNGKGFIVVGNDHRAHGETDADKLGLAGEGDLFDNTVADLLFITEWAKERWKLPLFFLGHSYGSFLAQAYLLEASGEIAGCVLSGSALQNRMTVLFGRTVAKVACRRRRDEPGKFFAGLTFVGYDKKVKDGANGWICRDREIVDRYNADEKCAFTCSNGFYKSMFDGLLGLIKADFGNVRLQLPLLIIYGSEDYVGGKGKLVMPLVRKYESAGLKPRVIRYDGARHEVLNETNRDEVYGDILEFFCEFA